MSKDRKDLVRILTAHSRADQEMMNAATQRLEAEVARLKRDNRRLRTQLKRLQQLARQVGAEVIE